MFDVLVIGGGQAGLAIGHYLQSTSLRYQIIERHGRVGDSWRRRYDSLLLFTPRAYSALPGLPVSGDPEGYPDKDEIADYLEAYAHHFELPVALGSGIRSLERLNGGFRATSDSGAQIDCQAIVLATGAFQQPAIPAIARHLSADVLQLSPESYKRPGQVPPGRALVVGDGATGRHIARELTDSHEVFLATGRRRRLSRERILGRNVFWWMDRLGLLRLSRETAIGKYFMKGDPFPGRGLEFTRLRQRGVNVVGRLTQAEGRKVAFADGTTTEIDAVIWATGYKDKSDWVAISEVKDARGNFVHYRGISPLPNFYFIGRSWQWTRGSALLTGVGADAAYVTEQIVRHLEGKPLYERVAA